MKKNAILAIASITIVIIVISSAFYVMNNQSLTAQELWDHHKFQPENWTFEPDDSFKVRDKVVSSNVFSLPNIIIPAHWNDDIIIDESQTNTFTLVMFESSENPVYFSDDRKSDFPPNTTVSCVIDVKEYEIGYWAKNGTSQYLPDTIYYPLMILSFQSALIPSNQFSFFDYSLNVSGDKPVLTINEISTYYPSPLYNNNVTFAIGTSETSVYRLFPVAVYEDGVFIGNLSDEGNTFLLKAGQTFIIDTDSETFLHLRIVYHNAYLSEFQLAIIPEV